MKIASDKLAHLKVGCLGGVAGGIVGLLVEGLFSAITGVDLPATAAHVSAATGSLVCAITSGLVKEFVDYQDNKAMPGMHGVEAWDAVATAAPGLALAAALLAIAANA